MTGWESWLIGLSIVLIAIAFIVLVIFLIKALQDLRCSLHNTSKLIQNTQHVVTDIEKKLHAFDALFHAASDLGQTVQKSVSAVRGIAEETALTYEMEEEQKIENTSRAILEVVEWALVGVALWQKLKKR